MNPKDRTLSSGWTGLIVVALVAGMLTAGWIAPQGLNLVLIAVLMFLVMVVLGLSITGRPLGILINERRLMSLSRLQMALWTLIILPGYLAIALSRIREGGLEDPLAIAIDWRLWALIGISTSSLVGTPLIYSTKKQKEPAEEAVTEAAMAFAETPDEVNKNREGTLYGNEEIADARFTDIFEGDELKNTRYIDMAKVQMFFFTVIGAVSYAVLLFHAIRTTEPLELTAMPVLPEGLVAILGISHAGYLTSKAIDYTKTK